MYDIRELWQEGKTVCITTNGCVKSNHQAVMGKGNAKAMADFIPILPLCLGNHIKLNGNNVGYIYERVICFPTKPEVYVEGVDTLINDKYKNLNTNTIHGWMCKSRLSLIEQSVKQLNELAKNDVFTDHIYLPFPGIENGMLDKAAVLPLLSKLDNKVIVITLDKIVNIVRC